MQINSDVLLGRLSILAGIAAIGSSLCAAGFYPQFPIWLAVLSGAAIGCPLLFIGFRLEPAANPQAAGQFWPSHTEAWNMAGLLLAYAAAFSAPVILFLPLLWLVPAGDDWPVVAIRILLVTVAISATYWWLEFAKKKLSNLFGGQLFGATIDAVAVAERRREPASVWGAARQNWELLFLAVLAFLVAYWMLNFNNPAAILNNGPRRLRGAIQVLQWCRGNPNTVVSSSVLVGSFSLGLYVYRIGRGWLCSNDCSSWRC